MREVVSRIQKRLDDKLIASPLEDVVIGFNSIQKHIKKAGWTALGEVAYIFYNPDFDLLYDVYIPMLEENGVTLQIVSQSAMSPVVHFLGIKTLSVLLVKQTNKGV